MSSKEEILEIIDTALIGGNAEQVVTNYNDYAARYDKDLTAVGYFDTAPKILADTCLKLLNKDTENCAILDAGCGTGMVGRHLRQLGYKGILHGVDGSSGMLTIAEQTSAYDQLNNQFIEAGKTLNFKKVFYDAVLSSGCLSSSHFKPEVMELFVEYVKAGGHLIYNTRHNATDYRMKLEMVAQNLVDKNITTEVNVQQVPFCDIDYKGLGTLSVQYCYLKH